MDSNNWERLHEMLVGCCGSLFASVGQETTLVREPPRHAVQRGERLTSFVGFGGNELQGAITLDLPIELVSRLHPAAATNPALDMADLSDWAGELVNQLLGRMKNALIPYGIALQMSTPSTVWGVMTHSAKQHGAGATELSFVGGAHVLSLYFDARALIPIDLTTPSIVEDEESPSEGDMMILL